MTRWPRATRRWLLPLLVLLATMTVPGWQAPIVGPGPVLVVRAQVSTPLPPMRDLETLAREVAALHRANGGATVNLYFGDLSGEPFHVVSVYPELTLTIEGAEVDPRVLAQFAAQHLALLADPRNNLGTWYNADEGRTHVDVSTALADRELALEFGRRYNQAGIFDLMRLEFIEVGGSGEPPPNLPPLHQRLPALPPGVLPRK
jgi:hypothetical protein